MNPELLRNLWLELTPQRLVAMPGILALVFLATWGGSGDPDTLARLALTLFVLITVFWGAALAAGSLSEEFAQNTWDAQRASGLSAAQMLAGKLAGGAAFAWYGGALCLAMFAAALLLGARADGAAQTVAGLVALAVLAQSAGLLSTLLGWRRSRQPAVRSRAALIVAGLLLFGLVGQGLDALRAGGLEPVRWYGMTFERPGFVLASVVAFAGWGLLGAWRLLREEMRFANGPWAWLAFFAFAVLWPGGWLHGRGPLGGSALGSHPLLLHALLGGAIAALATYGFLLHERKDPVRAMRLAERLRRDPGGAAADLPLWLVNLALTAAFGLLAVALGAWQLPPVPAIGLAAFVVAALAFLLRDVAIVLWCNLAPDPRRADTAALVYLLVLWGLMPLVAATLAAGWLSALFLPHLAYDQPVWMLAPMLQAAAALDLLLRRWRRYLRQGALA